MWPSKVFIPLPDQGDKQNTGDTCARRKDEKEHFFSLLYFALDSVVSEIGIRDNLLSYKIHMDICKSMKTFITLFDTHDVV